MRRHTLIGERILAAAPALGPVARLVRSSHERWDGDGYPDGSAGEDIPLGARIVAVCDAFDAMIVRPPLPRGAQPAAEALAELRRCAGTQFDPDVVAAFAAVLAADGRADELTLRLARTQLAQEREHGLPHRVEAARRRACRACPAARRRSG